MIMLSFTMMPAALVQFCFNVIFMLRIPRNSSVWQYYENSCVRGISEVFLITCHRIFPGKVFLMFLVKGETRLVFFKFKISNENIDYSS